MDGMRHRELIEQLESIENRLQFRWSPFLLSLGIALWCGLALGPALVAAWAAHWIIYSVEFLIAGVVRARLKEGGS